ncbi:MAG: polysaccharide biosynthesis protein [Reichenbachiella sp.]|uniref:polysaccharide biosynthesis protein n=1 Tax=Reichenbachiella sp. TaxID=2184521 RepID=UPI0032655ABA
MLNDQSIFITGGTGTLGKVFLEKVLIEYHNVKKITIYSRDEMKQYDLRRHYPSDQFPKIQWVIGAIRDQDMTGFFCTEQRTADSMLYAVENRRGGEIFIPKMIAKKITSVAQEIAPNCEYEIIGLRGFEKISEKLVSDIDFEYIHENQDYWIIYHVNFESCGSKSDKITKRVVNVDLIDCQCANKSVFKYELN